MRKAILAALAIATFTIITTGPSSSVAAQSVPHGVSQLTDDGGFNTPFDALANGQSGKGILIWPGSRVAMGVSIPDQGSILIGGFADHAIPGSGLLLRGSNAVGYLFPLNPPNSSAIDHPINDADNRPTLSWFNDLIDLL